MPQPYRKFARSWGPRQNGADKPHHKGGANNDIDDSDDDNDDDGAGDLVPGAARLPHPAARQHVGAGLLQHSRHIQVNMYGHQ